MKGDLWVFGAIIIATIVVGPIMLFALVWDLLCFFIKGAPVYHLKGGVWQDKDPNLGHRINRWFENR